MATAKKPIRFVVLRNFPTMPKRPSHSSVLLLLLNTDCLKFQKQLYKLGLMYFMGQLYYTADCNSGSKFSEKTNGLCTLKQWEANISCCFGKLDELTEGLEWFHFRYYLIKSKCLQILCVYFL